MEYPINPKFESKRNSTFYSLVANTLNFIYLNASYRSGLDHEKLANVPKIFIANHQSMHDIPLTSNFMLRFFGEQPHYVMKNSIPGIFDYLAGIRIIRGKDIRAFSKHDIGEIVDLVDAGLETENMGFTIRDQLNDNSDEELDPNLFLQKITECNTTKNLIDMYLNENKIPIDCEHLINTIYRTQFPKAQPFLSELKEYSLDKLYNYTMPSLFNKNESIVIYPQGTRSENTPLPRKALEGIVNACNKSKNIVHIVPLEISMGKTFGIPHFKIEGNDSFVLPNANAELLHNLLIQRNTKFYY